LFAKAGGKVTFAVKGPNKRQYVSVEPVA